MNEWTMIKCLGEANLAKAIDDYEQKGWDIHTVMFVGVEMVAKKFDIKQQPIPIPQFLVLARRFPTSEDA